MYFDEAHSMTPEQMTEMSLALLRSENTRLTEERNDLRRNLHEALESFREDRARWEKEKRSLQREIENLHCRSLDGTDPEWAI